MKAQFASRRYGNCVEVSQDPGDNTAKTSDSGMWNIREGILISF